MRADGAPRRRFRCFAEALSMDADAGFATPTTSLMLLDDAV